MITMQQTSISGKLITFEYVDDVPFRNDELRLVKGFRVTYDGNTIIECQDSYYAKQVYKNLKYL